RRHFRVLHGARLRDALHQLIAVPALGLRDLYEILIHVRHHDAGLIPHERHGEQRLEARAAAGDDRDGAGRGHRRHVAVAEHLHRTDAIALLVARAGLVRTPDGLRPLGEGAALLGEALALLLPFHVDELHHLAAELDTLIRVVRDA